MLLINPLCQLKPLHWQVQTKQLKICVSVEKICWAACGIKQQEERGTVTVTVDFYKQLCNPWRESPEGLEVLLLIPSPAHAPPSLFLQPLQLLSRLQLSPARADFSSIPPVVPVQASGKIFCSLLSDSCTLSMHVELLEKG